MKNQTTRWGLETNNGTLRAPVAEELLGTASLEPSGAFEAGSWQSFTLIYTAGRYGIDDSGSLRVCFRFASDGTNPQFDDPAAPGFCTVEASNGAVLQTRFDPKGNVRPWDRTLWIKVVKGYLMEGDTITIRFGDRSGRSPGMRLQTFVEDSFEFRVLVDPIATFNFQTLPEQPAIEIVSGPPARYVAVVPTLRRPGEAFSLRLKGEDRWGNPSDKCDVTLSLRARGPIAGLPETVRLQSGQFSVEIEGLTGSADGDGWIDLTGLDGTLLARSNPIRFDSAAEHLHFWGDLHGQSEETIGNNSARGYFSFARDRGFVDACGHQGNDFQISRAFWDHLNALTAEFDAPSRFVALPGYEWSGNTSLGGDRNVYFPNEGRVIRRSSHALIEDDDTETDCSTAGELFEAFDAADETDVVMFAHCGGRYADIRRFHNGRFERSVEVHSSWGSFEWLLHDAFEMGYRVGVVANSDGHKGRPGASYPGAGLFGAIGGLTCYEMTALDRPTLLDCLRRRRHYATSGGPTGRLMLDLTLDLGADTEIWGDDPALFPNAVPERGATARMGDIVRFGADAASLRLSVSAASPIERVDVFSGRAHLRTLKPYAPKDLGNRVRILWEGAAYRGRFRQVIWDGGLTVEGVGLRDFAEVAFLNRDKSIERRGNRLSWKSVTTGNQSGVDLWLEAPGGAIAFETGPITARFDLSALGADDLVHDLDGALPRFVRVSRLPDTNQYLTFDTTLTITTDGTADAPIWVRVALEDGTRAWSSPIYLCPKPEMKRDAFSEASDVFFSPPLPA